MKKVEEPVEPVADYLINPTNAGSLYRGLIKGAEVKKKTGLAKFNV